MKKIQLSGKNGKGKFALVDDRDFDFLNQYGWYFHHGYARHDFKLGKIYMHRLINQTPEGFETDHIDRNRLNNRRNNLRDVNRSQNAINTGIRKDNISGFKGIHWDKDRKKWMVYLNLKSIRHNIGRFFNIQDAIMARKQAEVLFYGNT